MLDQTRIRLDAINHVVTLREKWVAVPASELKTFRSGSRRIFLRGSQGIFKPKELSEPLSIQSTLQSRYNDVLVEGRKTVYDFLPRSREHENDGLKRCGALGLPLIYLLQVKPRPDAEYEIFAPVHICGWSDQERAFLVDLSGQPADHVGSTTTLPELQLTLPQMPAPGDPQEVRELASEYLVTSVQRRIEQARFRRDVLRAYGERCAVCLLRVRPLLDAARLRDGGSDVRFGVALCALHLSAYNAGLLRWDAAYIVRIHYRGTPGDGERAMLFAFDGKPLALPADESQWPRADE